MEDHICECGWNAVLERGLNAGYCKIIGGQETSTDFGPGADFEVECTCPFCENVFYYHDGYP